MMYTGIVQKGIQHGTKLGFPTVNIPLNDDAVSGIYAGTVEHEGKTYRAAIYANQERDILEAHVLEACPDVLGEKITITLLKKLRDDRRFETDELLQTEIARDVEHAKEFFAQSA